MNLSITLPDNIAQKLEEHWQNLPRHALETLVADAYREGLLTGAQVQTILDIPSRLGVHEFLKSSGVFLSYTEEALDQDLRAIRQVYGS